MHPIINMSMQVKILKGLEEFSYSTAYFLLMDEQLAVSVTKAALLEVSKRSCFFTKSCSEQQCMLRKVIIQETFRVKNSKQTG